MKNNRSPILARTVTSDVSATQDLDPLRERQSGERSGPSGRPLVVKAAWVFGVSTAAVVIAALLLDDIAAAIPVLLIAVIFMLGSGVLLLFLGVTRLLGSRSPARGDEEMIDEEPTSDPPPVDE